MYRYEFTYEQREALKDALYAMVAAQDECEDGSDRRYLELLRYLSAAEQKNNDFCRVCGDEFTPRRRGAMYCTPACKQKAVRKRQKQAA